MFDLSKGQTNERIQPLNLISSSQTLRPGPTLEQLALLQQQQKSPKAQPTKSTGISPLVNFTTSGEAESPFKTIPMKDASIPSTSNNATITQWNPSFLDWLKSLNVKESITSGMKTGIIGNITKPIAEKLTEGFYKNAKMAYPEELNKSMPELYQPQNVAEKGLSFFGSMVGDAPLMLLNPGSAAVSKVAPAMNTVAREAIGQGITGGLLGTTQGIVAGGSPSDIAEQAAFGTVLGGALGGGFAGTRALTNKINANKLAKQLANSHTALQDIQNAYKVPASKVLDFEIPPNYISGLGGIKPQTASSPFGTASIDDLLKNTNVESEFTKNPANVSVTFEIPNVPKKEPPKYNIPDTSDFLAAQHPGVARPEGRQFTISPVKAKDWKQLQSDAESLLGSSVKSSKVANTKMESLFPEKTLDLEIPLDANGKLDFSKVKKTTGTLKGPNKVMAAKIEGTGTPQDAQITSGTIKSIPKAEHQATEKLPEPQSKIIVGKAKESLSFKDSLKRFYTRVVNTQQPIYDLEKTTGTDIGKMASNTRNVSGIVDYNITKGLVNKNGNKVGKSLKEVVETIPKGREEDFWTYMSQRHNIDRAREGKPVQANYTPEMSAKAVAKYEAENPGYKEIGDNIVKWIDDFMQTWGVDNGIVNKETYRNLREMYPSYFPTQREFSELEKTIPEGLTKKFVDQKTPIKKATGSRRNIIDPVENTMNLVNKVVRTVKYNEVGQSLLESVRKNPERMQKFAEVAPIKEGMFGKPDNVISVLENGKPVYLQINSKPLLDALNGLPKAINNVPYLTATTNVVKSLITQKNPFFALRNLARDIPTAYVYGSEPNPFKFGKDLLGAGKDIITNSPKLQKYQAVGGGVSNFFKGDVAQTAAELMGKKSSITKQLKHPIHTIGQTKFVKGIEKFNNLIETAPRLAEFNRVLNKTDDVTKALNAANEVTVNFARGGDITKKLDKLGTLYANAGIQGLDRFFRGFKNPKTAVATLIKGGIAITVPDVALYLLNRNDPNYKALDNRTKDTYYLVPKDDGTFIKIPKSRELGVLFGSLFDRVLRQTEGQKEAFKGFTNSLVTNFAPANPIENNLLTPAFINIPRNKDFADRPIVPQGMIMDKRSKYLQYDDKTTSIAKAIGKYSRNPLLPGGLSPKQVDYLIKSYSGIIGQFGIPLATPSSSPLKALGIQFTSDPLFNNQATTDFYDKLDKLSKTATDKNIVEKLQSKKVTQEEDIKNSMQGISSALSKATKQINLIQSGPSPTKEQKTKAIRKQMLQIMKEANVAETPAAMQQVETKAKNLFK